MKLNTVLGFVLAISGALAALPLQAGESRTHIGAYGELHYNNLPSAKVNGDETIDFHRFVVFLSHDFSDSIHFFSEVEIEHGFVAAEDAAGEVEIEQAYIQFQLNDQLSLVAGQFLVPVGLLNETHEPPSFYGVERNPVEKRIIPATWWEAGLMLSGQLQEWGVSYDLAYHSGLDAGANIRSGRQKVSKAEAENKAVTARIKYSGIAGLELAASLQYQEDSDQLKGGAGSAVLFETHARLQKDRFGLSGLYAVWDLEGAVGTEFLETQSGYYLEGSYRLSEQIGFFIRHNQLNYRRNAGLALDEKQQNFGVNYWPHEDVVVKADYQLQNDDAGDKDGFNLGLGYQF
ncbi:MAG: OprO/OprP family phosphate-selective porin [Gammaproteobacteria bacterium]|nr:OprO/OprP family phosphate-selective porin [Gammaproteobacteria bacterium]